MDKAAPPVFVGIDVSKHRLDIHLRPSGEGSTIDHDDGNVAALVERLVALDARVRVAPTGRRAEERLAIRPYPKELEEEVALADGRRLRLRPIRPEDEPALVAAFRQLSPEAVRLRFFAPLKVLTHEAAARLTYIDYDREMALVLAGPGARARRSSTPWRASRPTRTTSGRSSPWRCATTSPAEGSVPCWCAA
jgi:hypothetical protein